MKNEGKKSRKPSNKAPRHVPAGEEERRRGATQLDSST